MEAQLGFGAVLGQAFVRPGRLFDAWKVGRVRVNPFLVYALGLLAAWSGQAAEFGRRAGSPVFGFFLMWLLVGLVLLPLFWHCGTGVLHLLARALGGKGHLRDTKVAVGLGSAPRLLGLFALVAGENGIWSYLAFVTLLAEGWSYATTGVGLCRLHELKVWRCVIVMLLPVLVPVTLALAGRAAVIEAFKIPSGGMYPTLEVHDHLFVTKSSYGLFQKSAPGRGDVVVFEYPRADSDEPRVDFMQRVIAIPGDTLQVDSGALIINGWKVPRCRVGRATVELVPETHTIEVFVEFLEGHAYVVALDVARELGMAGPYVVAPGEFWAMGDNRNNSYDSRRWPGGAGGGVPFENLRGRAWMLWLPPERIGLKLHAAPSLPRSLRSLQPQLERCLATAPSLAESTPPPRNLGTAPHSRSLP